MAGLLEMPLCGTKSPGKGKLLFAIPPGSVIGHEILLYGLYEKDVARCFGRLVSPGDLVIDIGANLGQYTLIASDRVGPTGRVLSIEPVPHIHRQLLRHIRVNRIENVTVVEAALGREDGTIPMSIIPDENDGMHHVAENESVDSICVAQRRLDEVIRETLPPRDISLVKIDVEGWEENVFAGAEHLLGQAMPPTIFFEFIEEHAKRFGLSAHRLVARFRGLGYRIFAINGTNRPFEIAKETPPPEGVCNLLACHHSNTRHLKLLRARATST